MKRYFATLLLLITGLCFTAACGGGDDDPAPSGGKITVNPTSLTFSADEGEQSFSVTANADWTAYTDADWLRVEKQRDNATVKVRALANTDGAERNSVVTVKSGSTKVNVTVTQSAGNVDPSIPTPEGYKLVWSDEFDSGTEPSAQWWYETGAGGWGNNEIQNYVKCRTPEGEQLAIVSDGTLKIKCAKVGSTVYSIRMNTKEGWKYGWFEARLKLPKGKGTWPAFWMMPQNFNTWPGDGEIDIMEEVGYHPNYVSSSIHCNAYNHMIGTQKTREILCSTAQSEFHVYACEWTKDFIRTYVDGQLLFTFENDGRNNYDTWPFYAPFYLKLNLAWGGNWGGAQGIDETCLPATYEIDYVRVFQKK